LKPWGILDGDGGPTGGEERWITNRGAEKGTNGHPSWKTMRGGTLKTPDTEEPTPGTGTAKASA